jgi:GT2 family glycosyltransferase
MADSVETACTLGVSIVLHNSALPVLEATLVSLARALEEAKTSVQSCRITLVDNASEEAYRKALQPIVDRALARERLRGTVELRLCEGNPGFGAAHNAAQAGADEDLLLILNPDVELAKDALQQGIAYLRDHPEVVAVNPRSQRPDGTPEFLCKRHPAFADLLLRGAGSDALRTRFDARLARYEYRDRDPAIAAPVELLSGACLLCRREAFQACSGFDPRFFLYFEDFDLARRLTRIGELHYLPRMRVVHHGGFAASKGWRHRRWFLASALRFSSRHGWKLF